MPLAAAVRAWLLSDSYTEVLDNWITVYWITFTYISMYYMDIQQKPQGAKYCIHVGTDCSNADCIETLPGQLSSC